MDFCLDALDDFHVGFNKIGTLLLRAVRSAATDAVNSVLGIIGCSITCFCIPVSAMTGIVQEIYDVIVQALKEYGRTSLTHYGIPQSIVNMMPWDFNEND